MANKLKMKLFVLTYSVVDGSLFVLAKNEKDLFERYSNLLICDDTYETAWKAIPGKRTDAAVRRCYNQLVREVRNDGVVEVRWSAQNEGRYEGSVRWAEHDVSDAEIEFLQRIGKLEIPAAIAKAS